MTFKYFLASLCYVKCHDILAKFLVHLLEHLSFWLKYPSFLLSKLASQLKLIQSLVRVGILGICVTSSILRVLLSGFWVSGLQFPSPRDRVSGSWVPGSHVAGSQSPKSQGLRVPSLIVLGSWVSGLRVLGPRSQVLILDYAVSQVLITIWKLTKDFHFCYTYNSFGSNQQE